MRNPAGSGAGLLTLTTDFGTDDHYVGAMKGVAATVAPGVRVIDITHAIPRCEIDEGAFALAQACWFFPEGTVHVVVVDPGVGTKRRPVAAASSGHFFVAPDNGVLAQALAGKPYELRRIDLRHGLGALSRTFHGRDLFAPAGARLAAGLPFAEMGPVLRSGRWPLPAAAAAGRVLHVDGFGNVVTSFRVADVGPGCGLALGGRVVRATAAAYAEAPPGELFLIAGSSGYLEISLYRASAAEVLAVRTGAAVSLVANEEGGRPPSVA